MEWLTVCFFSIPKLILSKGASMYKARHKIKQKA